MIEWLDKFLKNLTKISFLNRTNELKNNNEMIMEDLDQEEFPQCEDDRILQAPSEHEEPEREEHEHRIDTTEVDDENNRDENGNYSYEFDR